MPRMSHQVVLKNLLPKGDKRLRVTPRIHPVRGKPGFPACRKGPGGALTAGKGAEGTGEVQLEEPPGTFLAKVQQAKEAKQKQ